MGREVRAGLLPAGASFLLRSREEGGRGCSSGEGGFGRRTIQNTAPNSGEAGLTGGTLEISAGPPARPALAGAKSKKAKM